MIKTLREAFKMKDVRKKILITLVLLLVYRVGCFIPIPGIDPSRFTEITDSENGGTAGFLSLLSSLSGGALSNGAIFALGVGPYITSSIVMQLLTYAVPSLTRLAKQGDEGRRKIAVYTRYAALGMALAQAIAIAVSLGASEHIHGSLFGDNVPPLIVGAIIVLVLVAGAMFTAWLGDKITEHGVCSGISMLVFVGIIASGVKAFYQSFLTVINEGIDYIADPLIFVIMLALFFFLIVFVDLAERRIPVTYTKQVRGNKLYGGQNSVIPIKISAVGVIPIIFAFSLLNFPQLIMSIFWPSSGAYNWYASNIGSGSVVNIVLTALLILGFAYFYASMYFNPDDVSRQIQQSGGFILGYRPGIATRDYLKRVSNRITLFGALFLMFMALIPSLIFTLALNDGGVLLNAYASIGMLIIVGVALEFNRQLNDLMLMKTYKGFLK